MEDFIRSMASQGMSVERDGLELTFTPKTPFTNEMTDSERDPDNWLIQVPDSERVHYTVTLSNVTTNETCTQSAACHAKREVHRSGHQLFFDIYTHTDKLCRVNFEDLMRLDVTALWTTKSGVARSQKVVRGTFVANDSDTAVGAPGWAIYVNDKVFVHVGAMKVLSAERQINMFVSSVSVSAPLLDNPYRP